MKFTNKEKKSLQSLVGKNLRKVVYYYWKNLQGGGGYSTLDWVELIFDDKSSVVFHQGEESDGIHLCGTFDFQEEDKKLRERFCGQIAVARENMTLEKYWLGALEFPLADVRIARDDDNTSLILLWNDDHQVEIVAAEEGLAIDFYEEI